jgi:Rps23 Pro-64 3,4-dihydroxylase Tpa1-like proline 4-hydroxylase
MLEYTEGQFYQVHHDQNSPRSSASRLFLPSPIPAPQMLEYTEDLFYFRR